MTNWAKLPKITWGTNFANTIDVKYPVDEWRSYSEAREGSAFLQVESGEEDAWVIGDDYVFEGNFRWIPTLSSPGQTGWDGITGWRNFLEWARRKNQFRYYPDKNSNTYYTSYLVEPMDGGHDTEQDGTRSIRLKIRNSVSSYDGY
jgi:hypothetical protein